MKVFDYRERDPLPLKSMFPTDILDEPWIVYHGTSGALAAEIDTNGIRAARSIVDSNAIERIVGVFERLDWGGTHGGGYPVLAAFSTFDVSQGRPVFLGESALRVTTFAAADFAGGEVARAVHHALADLRRVVDGDWPANVRPEDRPAAITPEAIHGVARTLEELGNLRQAIAEIRAGHTHGVVYAVRLQPGDLVRAKHHKQMGLMIDGGVPAERLVAKALLPASFERSIGLNDRRAQFINESPILSVIRLVEELKKSLPGVPEEALAAALKATGMRLD